MSEAVTAKQLFEQLSSYDLDRVVFQMPDGLPIEVAHIEADELGGAVITMSDQSEAVGLG
jgi:hypothetical protein